VGAVVDGAAGGELGSTVGGALGGVTSGSGDGSEAGGGAGVGARVSQDARASAAARTIARVPGARRRAGSITIAGSVRLRDRVMDALLWLLLEAGVALALLLFIVWWTWPRKKK
jgi:hypothetical protein